MVPSRPVTRMVPPEELSVRRQVWPPASSVPAGLRAEVCWSLLDKALNFTGLS